MSATPLSDIQSIIERSLFETIRLELVDKGYLPDVTAYPNTPIGVQEYESDLNTIANGPLGFAIELFSEGSNHGKGVKKVPRIVLNSGSFLPGALGGDPQRFFKDNGTNFTAKVTPPQSVDFYVDFNLVSENVKQERILNAILALSIPRRGYIPYYTDSSTRFFTRYLNYYDADSTKEGIIEKVYGYEIPDVWDVNDVTFANSISKISQISNIPQKTAFLIFNFL